MEKNVLIPESLFMELYFFFKDYEPTNSPEIDWRRYVVITEGIEKKAGEILLRKTYSEYRQCHKDDRDANRQNYIDTKKAVKLRGARYGNV